MGPELLDKPLAFEIGLALWLGSVLLCGLSLRDRIGIEGEVVLDFDILLILLFTMAQLLAEARRLLHCVHFQIKEFALKASFEVQLQIKFIC